MSSKTDHQEKLKRFLEALPEELRADLLHILSCPLCGAGLRGSLNAEPTPHPRRRPPMRLPRRSISDAELDELRIL